MKRSAIFFQAVVVLIGIAALAFMLMEPHVEGRNAHATFFEIYFNDLFLAYAYLASIPFYYTLYQVFNLLEYYKQNKIFTEATQKSLRAIKYCAIAVIGFAVVGEIFIIMLNTSDDRAGGVFIGILIIAFSLTALIGANKFELKIKRNRIFPIC